MVRVDARDGDTGRSMERLKDTTIELLLGWARKKGLIVFLDTDGTLKIYPKRNLAWKQLEAMLLGRHAEVKMFLIKTTLEGEA